ncbi:metallophosphoesterase family protein [Qipengyuania marisflavi]|uniref:Serine/threonine protein phosphatase n=1 Tax=Qipengyuania marisflavi TaxID=2486356 RepID=A0A5S3PY54_9SPHN|nr:metallophosphoesterase family protein [Qipengyuania marisflavi]TMM48706.1 serine/threonine protein phosphatase [Qipengyuania marisflavi]
MIRPLRNFFRPERPQRRIARVPDGTRHYIVGDIHGRLDVFNALLVAIDEDDAASGAAETTLVLLGDLVDRGPESAGVIARTMALGKQRTLRCIAGNHEEMFLESFDDTEMLRHFVKHGGRETILSYGLDRATYNKLTIAELQQELIRVVPQDHRDFLSGFEDVIIIGDYVLVHAGIDPRRPLEEQRTGDLRWIRERFLKHTEPFSHVVVHGHTIFEEVENREHRIGIDTGAFRTGRLTALVLEGDRRRTIQAVETDGTIGIEKAEAE